MANWNLDVSHSSINFAVRHLMVSKVRGHFNKWTGSLDFDPSDLSKTKTQVEVEVASIDTKEGQRDGHLRSADFFDAENFPKLTFVSTSATKGDGTNFEIHGDITIRGVTKPVVLTVEYSGEAKDPWGGTRIGFTAHTSVNRKDFGLTWNQGLETGGVLVGEKVEINLEVEAIKA